jgi:hypothetical protein
MAMAMAMSKINDNSNEKSQWQKAMAILESRIVTTQI